MYGDNYIITLTAVLYLYNDHKDGDLHNDQTSSDVWQLYPYLHNDKTDGDPYNDQTSFNIYSKEHLELKLKSKLKLSNMCAYVISQPKQSYLCSLCGSLKTELKIYR